MNTSYNLSWGLRCAPPIGSWSNKFWCENKHIFSVSQQEGFIVYSHRMTHCTSLWALIHNTCGSLNVMGPYKLVGNDTLRICFFVSVGMGVTVGVYIEILYMLKSWTASQTTSYCSGARCTMPKSIDRNVSVCILPYCTKMILDKISENVNYWNKIVFL